MASQLQGESTEYRTKRDELLAAEIELREKVEEVAALRRALPLGRQVENYSFDSSRGSVRMSELFGQNDTLVLYSFMYGQDAERPCPMCSAFVDSLSGQMRHLQARVSLYLVSRSSQERLETYKQSRGWQDIEWLSAAANDYPVEFRSETPEGNQLPMLNVFVRRPEGIFHSWMSELFFAPSDYHPRHVDMVWPLWHFLDLTPEGRGDFLPSLDCP